MDLNSENEVMLSEIEAKNDNSDIYKEDQTDINTKNEEIGFRSDLKSHEKQTDQVCDKSHDIYFLINQPVSGMPGESRVLLENRMMSTSSKKQITNINRSCCV